MRFKNIEIQDALRVSAAAAAMGWSSCQLSAASLFCFAEKYDTEYCLYEGFNFIKQRRPFENGRVTRYFLPIPEPDGGLSANGRGLEAALVNLRRWHKDNIGEPLGVWGVADDMQGYAHEALLGAGLIEQPASRDWAEYVHTPENLIDMRGKRFHAKKNAVNQFIRNNSDFYYMPMDSRTLEEAADFQTRLLMAVRKFQPDKRAVAALEEENTAVMRGLKSFEALRLKGGILRVDGEIAAFAFGGEINPVCFDVSFEKGLRTYNGIFQVLEQEMLKGNVSGYKYINREEDLGEAGLRFAKERLRPDKLIYKREYLILA